MVFGEILVGALSTRNGLLWEAVEKFRNFEEEAERKMRGREFHLWHEIGEGGEGFIQKGKLGDEHKIWTLLHGRVCCRMLTAIHLSPFIIEGLIIQLLCTKLSFFQFLFAPHHHHRRHHHLLLLLLIRREWQVPSMPFTHTHTCSDDERGCCNTIDGLDRKVGEEYNDWRPIT